MTWWSAQAVVKDPQRRTDGMFGILATTEGDERLQQGLAPQIVPLDYPLRTFHRARPLTNLGMYFVLYIFLHYGSLCNVWRTTRNAEHSAGVPRSATRVLLAAAPRLLQGNLTTAVAYYREAIRLCPEFADAHSNLGNVLKVPHGQPSKNPWELLLVLDFDEVALAGRGTLFAARKVGASHAERRRVELTFVLHRSAAWTSPGDPLSAFESRNETLPMSL